MLTPWKESYDQPRHHIRKQRHYFDDKGPSTQSYGFSSGHVWIKKTEHQRPDAFELCCWRRLWRVPWTAILKEISPKYSLKGLIAEAEAPILWPADAMN